MARTDTLIPIELALSLRRKHLTWPQVSDQLYKMGYPPEPFPPFQSTSLINAVRKNK